jgi:uridine phosphorylase
MGVNRTHDAFYETTDNFIRLMDLPEYKKGELVSSEMECSAVFTVARLRGLKAGAVLAVNTSEPLEEISKNPNLVYQLEASPKAAKGVDDAIQVALMSIELLNKKY